MDKPDGEDQFQPFGAKENVLASGDVYRCLIVHVVLNNQTNTVRSLRAARSNAVKSQVGTFRAQYAFERVQI